MLQQGFERSSGKTAISGGDVGLKSGGHLLAAEIGGLARTAKTELFPRERYQHVVKLDGYVFVVYHGLCTSTRAFHGRYLHQASPTAKGHRRRVEGYDRASKWYNEKQRETALGSEATSLASCHMTFDPFRADSPES